LRPSCPLILVIFSFSRKSRWQGGANHRDVRMQQV
jgi:hypothetical protein